MKNCIFIIRLDNFGTSSAFMGNFRNR